MRESCEGCVHYRYFSSSQSLKGCNYAQDMPGLRLTDPAECRFNGKYAHKDSEEGKQRMANRNKEAWDWSVGYFEGYRLRVWGD